MGEGRPPHGGGCPPHGSGLAWVHLGWRGVEVDIETLKGALGLNVESGGLAGCARKRNMLTAVRLPLAPDLPSAF